MLRLKFKFPTSFYSPYTWSVVYPCKAPCKGNSYETICENIVSWYQTLVSSLPRETTFRHRRRKAHFMTGPHRQPSNKSFFLWRYAWYPPMTSLSILRFQATYTSPPMTKAHFNVFIHRLCLWIKVNRRWITNNFPCKWHTSTTSGSKSSPRKIFHRNSSGARTPTSNSAWTTKEKTSTRNRGAEGTSLSTAKATPTTRDRGTGDWNQRHYDRSLSKTHARQYM